MVNLVPAKCPNCGAQLELDDNMKRAECSFCKSTIIVDDAIAKYKIEISGKVEVDGIKTFNQKIEDAIKFFKIGKYVDAKKKLDEVLKDDPFNMTALYEWIKSMIMIYRNDPKKVDEKMSREENQLIWKLVEQIVEKYNQILKLDEEKNYKSELKDYIDELEYLDKQFKKLLEDEKQCKNYDKEINKNMGIRNYESTTHELFRILDIDWGEYIYIKETRQSSTPKGWTQSLNYDFSKIKTLRNGRVQFIYSCSYDIDGEKITLTPKSGLKTMEEAKPNFEKFVKYLKENYDEEYIKEQKRIKKEAKQEAKKNNPSLITRLFNRKK